MLQHGRRRANNEAVRLGIVYLAFLMCAYSAWVKGGVHPLLQWPVGFMAAALVAAVCLLPEEETGRIFHRARRDPIFKAGLVFMGLLLLQWMNSGHGIPSTDTHAFYLLRRQASILFPWAADRIGAAEMLIWFFPALVLILVIRHVLTRSEIKTFLYLTVLNGTALACVGIIQYALGLESIMGIWDAARRDFFATFAYPNHAAAWFYLHAAVAAGLAHDAEVKRKPKVRIFVWGSCFFFCLIASVLTLSRVGAFAALLMIGTAFVILCAKVRSRLRGNHAVNAYIALSLIPLLALALFFSAGGGGLFREIAGKPMNGRRSIVNDLSGRADHVAIASRMMGRSPVFGSGGRACHALADEYIPAEQMDSWFVGGRANVHCDPVQFLVEFGILGGLCLGVVAVVLASGAMASIRSGMLVRWMAAGCAAVMLHSLIDLPFRCPAILLVWCALLASMPVMARNKARRSGFEAGSTPRCG